MHPNNRSVYIDNFSCLIIKTNVLVGRCFSVVFNEIDKNCRALHGQRGPMHFGYVKSLVGPPQFETCMFTSAHSADDL